MKAILLLVLVSGCGGAVPAIYEAPDGGADAGCVFEGEDGAQLAPSTLAWWAPGCLP